MNYLWLGGWAIPPASLLNTAQTHVPQASHRVVYPGAHWQRHFTGEADCVVGYSLGAMLLLQHPEQVPEGAKMILLAPFDAFQAEEERGGRVRAVQMKRLLRQLAAQPLAAVNDFYGRAGLSSYAADTLPYALEDLQWGIQQLLETKAPKDSLIFVKNAFVGREDALLDPAKLKAHCPHLHVISNASHALEDLLPHAL